eukprot:GHVT01048659.1.p1 GENE.GHVT01048659.1~~GHVT01048659.1.p1  ORF type:complete len:241 (-),score=32.69 GHVT01048659.1:1367-2089(-)
METYSMAAEAAARNLASMCASAGLRLSSTQAETIVFSIVTLLLVFFFYRVSKWIAVSVFRLVGAASSLVRGRKGLGGRSPQLALLLGECDSGKTSLFLQLRNGRPGLTVSSMQANHSSVLLSDKLQAAAAAGNAHRHSGNNNMHDILHAKPLLVNLVDYPGHPRLHTGALKLLPQAKCIVYVIDSADKQAIKTSAERLYELLVHPQMHQFRPPLLVGCNKADLPAARPPEAIQEDLEREM